MPLSLMRETKRIRVLGPFAAGTTVRKSSGVDCNGHDTVMFIVSIGTITASGSVVMKLQGSDTDVDGAYVDLSGAEKTMLDGDDDKLMTLELIRPIHQYNRVVVTPTTANAVIDLGIAILGKHSRTEPVPRDTSDSAYGYSTFISPVAE